MVVVPSNYISYVRAKDTTEWYIRSTLTKYFRLDTMVLGGVELERETNYNKG